MGFDRYCPIPLGFRHSLDFIEQNCFAHPSKTGKQHALFGPLLLYAAQKDSRLIKNGIAPNEFGRW